MNAFAENMHNPAASVFHVNPYHTIQSPIVTGHWHTQTGYGTIREKGSEDWLLIYTVNGTGRIVCKDTAKIVKQGDLVIWPPHVPQDYRFHQGHVHKRNVKKDKNRFWEILWTHFIPWPHWLDILAWPHEQGSFLYLHIGDETQRGKLKALLAKMHSFGTGPFTFDTYAAMNALEEALLLCARIAGSEGDVRLDPRIKLVIDYICAHYREKITLEKLGNLCSLSPSRFSHLFRDQTGTTPGKFTDRQRIQHAEVLLAMSSFSISEVAEMAGFESQFYFSRRFTKYKGCSPKVFRAQHSGRN